MAMNGNWKALNLIIWYFFLDIGHQQPTGCAFANRAAFQLKKITLKLVMSNTESNFLIPIIDKALNKRGERKVIKTQDFGILSSLLNHKSHQDSGVNFEILFKLMSGRINDSRVKKFCCTPRRQDRDGDEESNSVEKLGLISQRRTLPCWNH